MAAPRTARHWCWTLHSPHYVSLDSIHRVLLRARELRYCVVQEERCPETNRLHLQGYLELSSPRGIAFVKDIIGTPAVHVEARKRTREEAREYCMKEDTRVTPYVEVGVWAAGGQGTRNDLQAVKSYIDANPLCSDVDLMDNFFDLSAKHLAYFRKYAAAKWPKRTEPPQVYVFYGAAGTGKSRLAHEMAPDAYVKPPGKWWDGYDGQADVICDDFYGTAHMPYPEWLKVCDRYRHTVEVKGGTVHLDNVKRIFFTSNQSPALWFNLEREYNSAAFSRRLHAVKHFVDAENVVDVNIPELFNPVL